MSKKVTGLVSWLRTWFDDIYELKGQGGASVEDCYPNGSLYFTKENVNPATWVGGNWTLITSSFTVGNETAYVWKRVEAVPELSVGVATPILSYYDSQSTQVFASYTEGGVGVGGKYVSFVFKDKNNNTVYSTTAQTNNNGVATTLYGSQGVGDVTIIAECMNVTETYSIEDCLVYDPLTSSSGKWTIPSGVSSEYTSSGWKVSASSYCQVKLTDKLTSACSVEITLLDYNYVSAGSSVILYQYTNGETTPNQIILANRIDGSNSKINVLGTVMNRELIKGGKYRIEYTSSTLKMYENDVLLGSATNNIGFPTRFEVHIGSGGRYAIYKDVKVKPL